MNTSRTLLGFGMGMQWVNTRVLGGYRLGDEMTWRGIGAAERWLTTPMG